MAIPMTLSSTWPSECSRPPSTQLSPPRLSLPRSHNRTLTPSHLHPNTSTHSASSPQPPIQRLNASGRRSSSASSTATTRARRRRDGWRRLIIARAAATLRGRRDRLAIPPKGERGAQLIELIKAAPLPIAPPRSPPADEEGEGGHANQDDARRGDAWPSPSGREPGRRHWRRQGDRLCTASEAR